MKSHQKMKSHPTHTLSICILGLALLASGPSLRAQHDSDPLAEHLFPPELLQETHQLIGLTEDQVSSLKAGIQKAQDRLSDLKRRLQDEVDALANLVKKERLEEEAVLAQFDKVMNLEQKIKRTQLALLVQIKNTLTAEQQAKLKEIKRYMAGLKDKMEKVKAAAQRWEQEGRDLSALRELKDELDPLLQAKKLKEAEAVLDRALKLLSGKEEK